MSDDYTTANVPGRLIMEKDAEITRLRSDLTAALAECERLNKSRNRWGKKYNDCLGKLRLAILSDSDYVKEIDCQNTRLLAENERLWEALLDTTASLVASVSLLERGGKKAAPSDKMFAQMLVDYKNSIDHAQAALEGVTEPASPWCDIESAPRDGTYIDLWVNDERIPDARWNDCRRQWEVWGTGDYDRMEFIPIAGNPTHWMPLPEPPK